jgi:hypothetical protein
MHLDPELVTVVGLFMRPGAARRPPRGVRRVGLAGRHGRGARGESGSGDRSRYGQAPTAAAPIILALLADMNEDIDRRRDKSEPWIGRGNRDLLSPLTLQCTREAGAASVGTRTRHEDMASGLLGQRMTTHSDRTSSPTTARDARTPTQRNAGKCNAQPRIGRPSSPTARPPDNSMRKNVN